MAGATLSTLDAILKEQYGKLIVEQLQSDTVMLQIAKKKATPFVGRRFIFPVHVGRNEGMGFRPEAVAMPAAGSQSYADAIVSPTYFYGRYQLTAQSMEQSRNDEGAFARAQTMEMQGLVRDVAKRLNQAFYLNKAGVRGTVASIATNTITLTSDAKGLEVGMYVDVYDSTLATKRNSTDLVISAVTSTAALNDTSVITFTFTGTATGIVSPDVVVQKGSISGGAGISAIGLADAISTGTYLGLNPATYPVWKANVLAAGGAKRSISEDLLQSAMDVTRQKSGQTVDTLITTYNIRRRLFNAMSPNRRFVNTKAVVIGGAESIDFDGKDLIVDPDAPNYTVLGLTKNTFTVGQTRDGHWVDDDGHVLHRALDDSDTYFATWRWFFQIACNQRNANFSLGDITE